MNIAIHFITFLQGALSSIAEGYIITNFFWSLLSKIPAYLLIGILNSGLLFSIIVSAKVCNYIVNILYILDTAPSWSYGSWMYNYQCSQCLSPLTVWVRIPHRRGVYNITNGVSSNPAQARRLQHYVMKFVGDLQYVGGFLRVLWFPAPIKRTDTI